MEINWLVALLKERGRSVDKQADSIVMAARNDSLKSTEAVFRIALGTGALSRDQGQQLLAALERMSTPESLAALSFTEDQATTKLRREIAELSEQQRQMRIEQANIVTQREAVSILESDATALQQKVREREEEIEDFEERIARLEALNEEFK